LLNLQGTYGNEQIINKQPFDSSSNMSIFSEDKYKYSVSALEDSSCMHGKSCFIKQLFLKNGGFAMGLLTKISG